MTHSAMRPEFEQLIDVYAPVGQLGTGFTFTEGPIWHPARSFSAVLRHAGRRAAALGRARRRA